MNLKAQTTHTHRIETIAHQVLSYLFENKGKYIEIEREMCCCVCLQKKDIKKGEKREIGYLWAEGY